MKELQALQKQRGISLSGLLLWAAVLVVLSISALKIAPAYLEFFSIKKNLAAIVKESDTQNIDMNQVRLLFGKRAAIDNIKSVGAQDIKVKKEGGQLILSASYQLKIPLVSNISLTIDFEAVSD